MRRSNTKGQHKVGLQFLGRNFRQAFDFYQMMADRYFDMSKKDKRCLGAAKRCFVIAAQNAVEITKLFNDPTNETKLQMNAKIKENLQFAEHIQQKIQTDPTCDAKKAFMAQFDAAE